MSQIPDLADLVQVVQTLAPQEIPPLMAQCAALQSALAARLVTTPASDNGQTQITDGDQLLTVEQAARKLGASEDWLYRHAKKLPFTVRLGRRHLRFSARGINKYIHQRQGR